MEPMTPLTTQPTSNGTVQGNHERTVADRTAESARDIIEREAREFERRINCSSISCITVSVCGTLMFALILFAFIRNNETTR